MKAFACLLFAIVLLLSSMARSDTLSQNEVVALVLRENPRLKAARAKWEAMKKRIPQAKAWEDPMVGVDVERMGTTRFDTFTDNEWMASQSVPITGKNLVRGRIARVGDKLINELRKEGASSEEEQGEFRLESPKVKRPQ